MRTDIGHFALEYDGVRYELIPSFKNMRMICEPEQMPAIYAEMFGAKLSEHIKKSEGIDTEAGLALYQSITESLIGRLNALAAFIVQCCCDDDTQALTGHYDYKQMTWIDGAMDSENLVHIARAMLTHGVTGKPDPDNRAQKGKTTDGIDVYKYADMAVAHLGVTPTEAANMTKTEFDRLIDAKYPDTKKGGNDAPTLSEHEQAMDWLDKVNAKREAQKAGK